MVRLRTPHGNGTGIDSLLADVYPHQSRKTDDRNLSTSVLCNIENHIPPSVAVRGSGIVDPFPGTL